MSDPWITSSNRLESQIDDLDVVEDIKRSLYEGDVDRVLSEVDEAGNVITYKLDEFGNKIGPWP